MISRAVAPGFDSCSEVAGQGGPDAPSGGQSSHDLLAP
jgi:hypothetical protein